MDELLHCYVILIKLPVLQMSLKAYSAQLEITEITYSRLSFAAPANAL